MPIDVNDTIESICPWNFNQSYAVNCQDFVYLQHEHGLLNEVKNVFTVACHLKVCLVEVTAKQKFQGEVK